MHDVIIIGNDLSSLIAAWRSAKRGYKTILICRHAPPYSLSLNDFTFDIDPLPWLSIPEAGFDLPRALTRETSVGDSGAIPALQVILPEHRVDFRHGLYDQIRELAREFPGEAQEAEQLYRQAMISSRSMESWLSLLSGQVRGATVIKSVPKYFLNAVAWRFRTRSLKAVSGLNAPLRFTLHLLSGEAGCRLEQIAASWHLARLLTAQPFLKQSKTEILKGLRDELDSLGVEVCQADEIPRILTGREIEVAIVQSEGQRLLTAKDLIVSLKWRDFAKLCQDQKIDHWRKRYLKSVAPFYRPYTIHIGLKNRAIPEQMASQVIVAPMGREPGKPLGGDLTFLSLSSPDDAGAAPTGMRTLSATVFLPMMSSGADLQYFRGVADNMMKRLDIVLPFLRENIVCLDIEACYKLHVDFQDVVNLKSDHGGCRPGFVPTSAGTRVKRNVVVTGGELFPALGFMGELLSGIHAADQISERGP